MPTESKLKIILREEKVTQKMIHNEIDKYFHPGVETYQISRIVSGTNINSTLKTYLKILAALNKLTKKSFKLADIVDFNIIKQDLRRKK